MTLGEAENHFCYFKPLFCYLGDMLSEDMELLMQLRVEVGMWFQIWGAAEEKARRPNSVFAHKRYVIFRGHLIHVKFFWLAKISLECLKPEISNFVHWLAMWNISFWIDKQSLKWACNFGEIIDNFSKMVQDRDVVTMEE